MAHATEGTSGHLTSEGVASGLVSATLSAPTELFLALFVAVLALLLIKLCLDHRPGLLREERREEGVEILLHLPILHKLKDLGGVVDRFGLGGGIVVPRVPAMIAVSVIDDAETVLPRIEVREEEFASLAVGGPDELVIRRKEFAYDRVRQIVDGDAEGGEVALLFYLKGIDNGFIEPVTIDIGDLSAVDVELVLPGRRLIRVTSG